MSDAELASFIVSIFVSLVFAGAVQYMRDVAGKAEEKCLNLKSRMAMSYPDLFGKLVSCGLCIKMSTRIMEQIVRDGASHAETMRNVKDMECPDLKSRITKVASVYAAVVAVVTLVIAVSSNASFLGTVLAFIIYYTLALYSAYSDLAKEMKALASKHEEAERAEAQLSELLSEINKKCGGECF